MPKLADTLVEGTVARWLKRPGDKVRKGDAIAEIETDKVNSELEAPADGVLAEVLIGEGDTVGVGTVIARISDGSHTPTNSAAEVAPADQGGMTLMRRRIAERMQESRARVAQGACVREVELPGRSPDQKTSSSALFIKALAVASNSSRIGLAVEIPDGLMVPVVGDANQASLDEISAQVRDLVSRARDGKLTAQDVQGAELTVTNVGPVGTLLAFPLVPAGQRGILAVGSIHDGHCFLTLCYDRSAMNDFQADRLLAGVAGELALLGKGEHGAS